MIEDRFPRELLSQEEVRALLESEAPGMTPEPDAAGAPSAVEPPRVLLVCRRGLETSWLSSRLAAHGAAVLCAKSPLAALELIRERPPRAVVSDIDLWARGGAALLERARQVGSVRVLLLAGGAERGFHLADGEDGGPWGYLGRPVEPAALEAAVTALLAAQPAPPASVARAAVDCRAPAASSSPPATILHDVAPAATGERHGEIAWLRFCLALTRELRSPDGVELRTARVLAAARETLGAREVGLRSLRQSGVEVRCHGSRRGLSLLFARLEEPGAPIAGTVVLGDRETSPVCLVLLGLDAGIEQAAGAFAADVNELLPAALRE